MRSPRRGDRMRDPLQRPGGPRRPLSSKTRVISSRPQKDLGFRNSNRATFDQKHSRSPNRKMLPPKDRSRPAVEERSRSPGSPVKDLREKLISKKKDMDKDEGNIKPKRDEEIEAKRGTAPKRTRNEKLQEEEGEEPVKKRSPVRVASPIDEPSVTSTVQNSELELDYEYESLNEEVDTPERAISPECPKSPKVDRKELNQGFADDNVEKTESPVKVKPKKEDIPRKEKMDKGKHEKHSHSRDEAADKRSSSESSTSESGSLSDSESTTTSETTSSSEEDEALKSKKKTKKADKKTVTPQKTAEDEALSVEKELEIEQRPGSLIIDKPTEEAAESESEESISQVEHRELTLPVFFNRVGLETAVGSDVKISHLDVLTITRSCKENNLVHWREKESSTPLSDRFARYSRLNPVARPGVLEEPIVLRVNMNAERSRRQAPLDTMPGKSSSSALVIPAPVIPPNWEDPKVRLTYYTTLGFLPKNATYEDMRAYERQRVGNVPSESRLRSHSESEDEYSVNTSRTEGSYRKKDKRKSDGPAYEEKKKKYI